MIDHWQRYRSLTPPFMVSYASFPSAGNPRNQSIYSWIPGMKNQPGMSCCITNCLPHCSLQLVHCFFFCVCLYVCLSVCLFSISLWIVDWVIRDQQWWMFLTCHYLSSIALYYFCLLCLWSTKYPIWSALRLSSCSAQTFAQKLKTFLRQCDDVAHLRTIYLALYKCTHHRAIIIIFLTLGRYIIVFILP